MTRSKTCYFPFNVFFFCQSLSSATIILPQSRLIKITFCSLSFRSTLISLILASFWFILPYSVVIPPRSGIFRYHSCLFRLIPVSFCFIPESFRLVPTCSGLFRFICVIPPHSGVIPVSFRLVSVYSGTILVHSVSFRCHSASFRHIPVYSVPFRSVPFLCLETPHGKGTGCCTWHAFVKCRRGFLHMTILITQVICVCTTAI